jgi:hypothetical protein
VRLVFIDASLHPRRAFLFLATLYFGSCTPINPEKGEFFIEETRKTGFSALVPARPSPISNKSGGWFYLSSNLSGATKDEIDIIQPDSTQFID